MLEKLKLSSLITENAQQGYELAVKLSRMGVISTQPSDEVLVKLKPIFQENVENLVASSQVVATNFQTVAAANNYWRD